MNYLADCIYSTRLISKLKVLETSSELDLELINKAIYWARKYHGDQKRKSGEPFYSHPLEVAYMISDYKLNTDVIVASILHDIVEDTEITVEMIHDSFGHRIAEMVDRLTRDRPDGTKLSVNEILNNSYQENDKEALLIKLVDRLHNIQTLGVKSPEKVKKITEETLTRFISLSMYLNVGCIEQELIKLLDWHWSYEPPTKRVNLLFLEDSFLLPSLLSRSKICPSRNL